MIEIEKKDYITWLTLNRPEFRNMMKLEFFDELSALFNEIDADPDTRAVIIKANGKSFTAGMDIQSLADIIMGKIANEKEMLRKLVLKMQAGFNAIEKCCKPVIAAVHSHCIGGGVDLISACDIRLASQDAVFSIRETKVAIVDDLGTLQRLPHIIGHGWFRELALTGRDFTAADAYKMGLITHLCEDREQLIEKSHAVANEIVACSPITIQGIKDSILFNRDHGVYAGLDYIAQKNAALLPNDDVIEALTAFKEKRKPKF